MNLRALLVVSAALLLGLGLGAAWGTTRPDEFRVVHRVQLDDVLQVDHWEAVPRAAEFTATMFEASTRREAGGDPADYAGIYSLLLEDSTIVDVWTETTEPDVAPERLAALADATLRDLIARERASVTAAMGDDMAELESVEAELGALAAEAGVTDGGNLAEDLDRARRDLEARELQLAATPADDAYWQSRLPGEITELENQIARLEPVVPAWTEAVARRSELATRTDGPEGRLRELEAAERVVDAGTAVRTLEAEALSRRAVVGRSAAVGAGAAAVLAAGALVLVGLRRSDPAAS